MTKGRFSCLSILTFVRMTAVRRGMLTAVNHGILRPTPPQLQTVFCFSNSCASSPLSYISIMMSEPPTNSPST